jgi:hypothetical protein
MWFRFYITLKVIVVGKQAKGQLGKLRGSGKKIFLRPIKRKWRVPKNLSPCFFQIMTSRQSGMFLSESELSRITVEVLEEIEDYNDKHSDL